MAGDPAHVTAALSLKPSCWLQQHDKVFACCSVRACDGGTDEFYVRLESLR